MPRILVVGAQSDIDNKDYPGVLIIRLGEGKISYIESLGDDK